MQFMASYYSAQCELTKDPLYDLCLEITVKALEKELDGGKSVSVNAGGLYNANKASPAVQPSTASILLRMLDDGKARPIDGLIFASGKSAPEVLSELLKLELTGKVRKLPGNRYVRR